MLSRQTSPTSLSNRLSPPLQGRHTAELLLCEKGIIRGIDAPAAKMFGYALVEIIGVHVSRLLPKLTESSLVDESSYRHLAYLGHCGAVFNGCRRNGDSFACTISFGQTDSAKGKARRLLVNEVTDKGTYRL